MKFVYTLIFALFVGHLFSQDLQWTLKKDVAFLSSDLTMGRFSGSDGELLAARYIAERLSAAGIEPRGTDGYFQPFTMRMPAHPHETEPSGEVLNPINVIGWIDNGAATTVVLGAHYDHLGVGEHGSRHTGEPAIHNGADDNASGVAVVLSLADRLKRSGPKGNNYLFIFFSGEELGLFGSKYFVSNPTIPLASINYMLNYDMVGRLDTVLVINGAGTSPVWKSTFEKIAPAGYKIVTTDSGIGPSDHTSFYLKDIPAIQFFSGQHADYHKPQDDAHLLNYEGMERIVQFSDRLLQLLDKDGRIAFSKTQDATPGRSTGFKVTMGVMPDYTFDGKGMRIDGVIDGRPAYNAGLKNGDIILRMATREILNIQDYMAALSGFEKGQTIVIGIMRGQEQMEISLTF